MLIFVSAILISMIPDYFMVNPEENICTRQEKYIFSFRSKSLYNEYPKFHNVSWKDVYYRHFLPEK